MNYCITNHGNSQLTLWIAWSFQGNHRRKKLSYIIFQSKKCRVISYRVSRIVPVMVILTYSKAILILRLRFQCKIWVTTKVKFLKQARFLILVWCLYLYLNVSITQVKLIALVAASNLLLTRGDNYFNWMMIFVIYFQKLYKESIEVVISWEIIIYLAT